jgi:hypothetical protein
MTSVLRDLASTVLLSKDIEANFAQKSPDEVMATRHMLESVTNLLRRLFTRDSRRTFCEPSHWVATGAVAEQESLVRAVVDTTDANHARWQRLLGRIPFAVPFETRVRIFHERVRSDRAEWQQRAEGVLGGQRGRWLRIRRNYLFEDAMERMGPLGADVKDKLRVQFVDVHGMEEAGIDGGGLFSACLQVVCLLPRVRSVASFHLNWSLLDVVQRNSCTSLSVWHLDLPTAFSSPRRSICCTQIPARTCLVAITCNISVF